MKVNNTLLALIHNNNELRNNYIRPMQKKLISDCPQVRSSVVEMYFHGEKPHSMLMAFFREIVNKKLDREWSRYRLIKPIFLPKDILSFVKCIFVKYLLNRAKWKVLSAIEVVHTDEHIRAWTIFLQTDAEFLIVFEDDAVFKEDSSHRVSDLIHSLSESEGGLPIYIDLAGGVKVEDLKIGNLQTKHDANFRHYSKPVTNTACVYLMNKSLVKIFHSILAQRPWLRLFQIDFLMNKLFIIMAHEGLNATCMHMDPTIFKHGSATGDYASSLNFGR